MRRLIITALAAPVLALGAGVASAAPAFASSPLCEASGSYCLGGPSLSWGSVVKEGNPGWNMTFNFDGGHDSAGNLTGTLVFTGASNTCAHVSIPGDTLVYTGACSGISGVTWGRNPLNGAFRYKNEKASSNEGVTLYMTGDGDGAQYTVQTAGHGFQRFLFQ
jgi:hypothetical protein